MIVHPQAKPKLRPVEAFPGGEAGTVNVRDPAGLSSVVLTLSEAAFVVLTLLDGRHTLADVREEFRQRFGQSLAFANLAGIVTHLEESLFLEGPAFESHYRRLCDQYRSAPAREVRDPASLGLGDPPGSVFEAMLERARVPDEPGSPGQDPASEAGRIVGLIAPHLDYPRGGPCYGSAYAALAAQDPPQRLVILGTNHFGVGNGGSVVATGLDFATPLGTACADRDFLERIERRCGDLRRFEYDHAGEHSVELQVCWLQHLFGPQEFGIVPFLCPDPCGPTGTAPGDGQGVDLADFARVLGETIEADERSTVIIAGADFSHVGSYFGDEGELDDAFLARVRDRDQAVLRRIQDGDTGLFLESAAATQTSTRICSAGCVFTLMAALPDASATILRYHQAVTESAQNCVTCAAVVFRK